MIFLWLDYCNTLGGILSLTNVIWILNLCAHVQYPQIQTTHLMISTLLFHSHHKDAMSCYFLHVLSNQLLFCLVPICQKRIPLYLFSIKHSYDLMTLIFFKEDLLCFWAWRHMPLLPGLKGKGVPELNRETVPRQQQRKGHLQIYF